MFTFFECISNSHEFVPLPAMRTGCYFLALFALQVFWVNYPLRSVSMPPPWAEFLFSSSPLGQFFYYFCRELAGFLCLIMPPFSIFESAVHTCACFSHTAVYVFRLMQSFRYTVFSFSVFLILLISFLWVAAYASVP